MNVSLPPLGTIDRFRNLIVSKCPAICGQAASFKQALVINSEIPNLLSLARYRYQTVQWITNQNGKQLAIFDGFTYSLNNKGGNFWRCTKRGTCKAHFIISNDGVTSHNFEHDHVPPRYVIRNGMFIKI
ncbi:FLYWCH zinc finger domain-containing protein [Phthorimaea operculella]|nr:FLYWCH zinc finger domain-containing protein [Phthorimaea operculella]